MPFITRLPALTGADPYPDALLALDFVGARRGPQYYKSGGVTVSDITQIPGWTYTGGTPAGIGSYAPRLDGSLQFFPSVTNLILQSQAFDNASWAKSGATLTANQTTAPDGTLTAEKLDEQTNTGSHQISQPATAVSGAAYTISFYMKAAERSYAAVWDGGTSKGKFFNLSAGTVGGNLIGAPDNATITSAGNGWYRCTITITTASTTVTPYIFTSTDGSTFNYTGVAGQGIYIWGAQLELGSTASTYIPTTTAAVTVAPPRITDAGYLPEEARTNLYVYSQAFDNAAWSKTAVTITADATTAPDGTATADLITEAASANFHFVNQVKGSTTTHVQMVYAKATGSGSKRYLVLSFQGAGVYTATFDVQAGTVTATSGAQYLTSEIASVGNGWYRCTATFTATGAGSAYFALSNSPTLGLNSYTGDGTSGIYIWQADLQAGSFATSPIPTTSVAVTRAADLTPGLSNITSAFDAANGTVFVEFARTTPTGSNARVFSANETVQINTNTANNAVMQFVANSATSANALTVGATSRVAGTWAGASTLALSLNGGAVATGTYALGSVTGQNLILGNRSAGDRSLNGPIRRVVIYPRAMSNAELQAITTAGAY